MSSSTKPSRTSPNPQAFASFPDFFCLILLTQPNSPTCCSLTVVFNCGAVVWDLYAVAMDIFSTGSFETPQPHGSQYLIHGQNMYQMHM